MSLGCLAKFIFKVLNVGSVNFLQSPSNWGEVGFQNLEIWSTVPINFHQTGLTKVKKLHFEATLSMITYDVQIVWRAQSALVH